MWTPPVYWPIWPPARSTRWHGTTTGTGLWPSAVPAARNAFGLPASLPADTRPADTRPCDDASEPDPR